MYYIHCHIQHSGRAFRDCNILYLITKTVEDLNNSSTSPLSLETDMTHCLKSSASVANETGSSVYPIVTVKCKGQSLHLLMNTGSDCTLVSREAVKRSNTPSHKSDEISIHGLADKVTTSSDEFATLDIAFGSSIIPIRGLIVSNICSPIYMTNPSSNDQLKYFPLTMDFRGSRFRKFKIDGLLGLATMAELLPANGVEKVQIMKIDGIVDKF